jgi:hypothetical protein
MLNLFRIESTQKLPKNEEKQPNNRPNWKIGKESGENPGHLFQKV